MSETPRNKKYTYFNFRRGMEQERKMRWQEHNIRVIGMARVIVERLLAGETVRLQTGMGSCECGDTYGRLWLQDGVVMAETNGRMSWQQYDARPASHFGLEPGYGMGRAIRLIAYIHEGETPDLSTLQYAFQGGTHIVS